MSSHHVFIDFNVIKFWFVLTCLVFDRWSQSGEAEFNQFRLHQRILCSRKISHLSKLDSGFREELPAWFAYLTESAFTGLQEWREIHSESRTDVVDAGWFLVDGLAAERQCYRHAHSSNRERTSTDSLRPIVHSNATIIMEMTDGKSILL